MNNRQTATEAEAALHKKHNIVTERFEINGMVFQVRDVLHHVLIATYVPPHQTKQYGANAYGWDKENSAPDLESTKWHKVDKEAVSKVPPEEVP